MTIEEIVEKFKEKPYLPKMGISILKKRLMSNEDNIRKARIIYKKNKLPKKSKAKILILDIETAPLKAYVWSRWKQNIYLEQTISEWFMICWSAKWFGYDNVMSDVLNKKEILSENDSRITKSLWSLIDEADILVAHNGKRFDIPKINSRFIINGLIPPSPYKQIDTKEVSSRQFGFSSNKLDALATYFNIENKDNTNFELWVNCMNGYEKSLKYMESYNKKDVIILEKVFIKLLPWIPSFPNMGIYINNIKSCSYCGCDDIIEDKFYYTNSNKYKVFRCNKCNGLSRSKKGEIKNNNILTAIPK